MSYAEDLYFGRLPKAKLNNKTRLTKVQALDEMQYLDDEQMDYLVSAAICHTAALGQNVSEHEIVIAIFEESSKKVNHCIKQAMELEL